METAELHQPIARKKAVTRTTRRTSLRSEATTLAKAAPATFPEQIGLANQDFNELLSILSHTLKTRLIAAESFSNLLLDELSSNVAADHLHYLQRISRNVHTMHQIIDDVLKLARFEALSLETEPVDVDELVRMLIHDSFPRRASQTLRFAIPRALPTVHANREGLRVIFDNLLSNAVKYRHASRPAHIEIASESLPRFVAFHVKDNGIGIATSEQADAFKPFQRGSNVGDIDGSGLGLSICQKIVEVHGGQLAMTSVPDQGTTLSFTLPK